MNEPSETYYDPWKAKAPPTHQAPSLSPADRDAIRGRLAGLDRLPGDLVKGLAVEYGVSAATIRRLKP